MRRRRVDPATVRLLASVDSESRPYTDPDARYPRAQDYRRQVAEGAARHDTAA
ncbi:hypothetical protein [Couchioplanes caeruleus]|uniref:Uncharacterized protein n=1 Tax=Couchioplanes caeruleus TaxID=56438 RepID=A0A3N1GBN6_9ACTN|nr:hypothetical protein [Couchioplanes caeruleus]ROP27653.1 hypothetical protein EDD30_0341 [Couchioplanes caeruleus]